MSSSMKWTRASAGGESETDDDDVLAATHPAAAGRRDVSRPWLCRTRIKGLVQQPWRVTACGPGDCGFGRQGFNRHLAFFKATGIPLARNILLKELGAPARYIPAADEKLAWDQLPDYESLTHSKPLR